MNYFINLKNGKASINTYRATGATETTIEDIVSQINDDKSEFLTASLDLYLIQKNIELYNEYKGVIFTRPEAEFLVFSDNDYVEEIMDDLGLLDEVIEIPELRDYQNDLKLAMLKQLLTIMSLNHL